jgi:putative ABC transport system substrate-binding protein
MNRRAFVTGLGAVLAAQRSARAQQTGKIPKIGILTTGTPTGGRRSLEAFRQELEAIGNVDGKTLTLEPRYAMGRIDRLDRLVGELLSTGAAILVTGGPYGSLAAVSGRRRRRRSSS